MGLMEGGCSRLSLIYGDKELHSKNVHATLVYTRVTGLDFFKQL